MTRFTNQSISIDGAPTIEFAFDHDVGTAELAGARLRVEAEGPDVARLALRDVDGALLADVTVHRLPTDETITVSVMNVGSALLWSHYRWQQAPKSDAA